MKDREIIDLLNNPREKYFGWFPRNKKAKVFFFGNIAYILFCCFIWPKTPPGYIWGWWQSTMWVSNFIIANWAAAMWGIYYYKIWPSLNDGWDNGYVEPNKEQKEAQK